MINRGCVILCNLEVVSDEHLDVVLHKHSMVDNDILDNHFDQEDYHMDNKLNMLVDIVYEYFVCLEMLDSLWALR